MSFLNLLGAPQRHFSQRAARLGVMCVLWTACGAVVAQNASPPRDGDRRGPPREAIEACANKAETDACSMTLPDREQPVTGQCVVTPEDSLACLPEGARPPQRK